MCFINVVFAVSKLIYSCLSICSPAGAATPSVPAKHVDENSDVVLGNVCSSAAGEQWRMLLEAAEDQAGGWSVKTVGVTRKH